MSCYCCYSNILGICWYSLASVSDNQYSFEKNALSKFTTTSLRYLGHFGTPYYMALSCNTLYVKLFIQTRLIRWVMWKRVHASLTGISAFIRAIKLKFVSVIALNSRQKRSCHHFGRVFNNRTSFNFISCEEVQKFKTADIFHVRLDKKIVNSNDK